MKVYVLTSYVIMFGATVFALWIILQEEEPEIFQNAVAALNCVILFILLCLGVFELCSCVM